MIKYTVSENDFKYNMKKGTLKVGSTISNKHHPLEEVNDFREKLLKEKKIKKEKDKYIVKQPIKTGMLMAYNLYQGSLKKEIDTPNQIYVSEENDIEIISSFDIKNMISTDNHFINQLIKNENKLIGIYKYSINQNFFIGNTPNNFSNTELLVGDFLKEKGIINKYRHGDTKNNEADIIVEEQNIQIEVIFEYKNKISKRGKIENNPLIISELIDTNLIDTSDALVKKLYEKTYSELYEKQLAILCLGNRDASKTMLEKIQETIEKKGYPKNNFKRIYVICIDIIDDIVYFYDGYKLTHEKTDKYTKKILCKNKIDFDEIQDDEEYLYEVINIFNDKKGIGVLDGKTIKELSKEIELIVKR